MRHRFCLLAVTLLAGSLSQFTLAAERLALVVGKADYTKVTALDNTVNDATDIATALEALDFRVLLRTDIANRNDFKNVIRDYRQELAKDPDNVGVFFYAGHAVQVEGENFLIPVEGDIRDQPDLAVEAITLGYVTAMTEDAGNGINLFFIDACRDNPFRGFSRSVRRGLAAFDTPRGSLITYAASPGSTASDGQGRNSPFTSNLLKQISSNQHILLMLQNVVKGVRADTGGQQQPWFHSSLTGDFYFNPEPEDNSSLQTASVSQQVTESSTTDRPALPALPSSNQPRNSSPAAVDQNKTTSQPVTQVDQPPELSALSSELADQRRLQGRWSGSVVHASTPEEPITISLQASNENSYEVDIVRLISFGGMPATCALASGKLALLQSGDYELRLDRAGCELSGILKMDGNRLQGMVQVGDHAMQISLTN